jgi:hypothetical protein
MGGSPAEKNAVLRFRNFGETPSAESEVSPGGRNHGGRNPPSFAGSTGARAVRHGYSFEFVAPGGAHRVSFLPASLAEIYVHVSPPGGNA